MNKLAIAKHKNPKVELYNMLFSEHNDVSDEEKSKALNDLRHIIQLDEKNIIIPCY